MKTNQPAYIITNNTIVVHLEGQTFTLQRNSVKGDAIVALIREKNWTELVEALTPAKAIPIKTGGLFTVGSDGQLYAIGDENPIHKTIGKKLLSFVSEGLPCEALVNFWNNLKLNPSQASIDQLYEFLEKNHHPLTDDGCFLAYKKVTRVGSELKDTHSRTFNNNVGDHVTMSRDAVNPDPNQTCSTGLHVASFEYAKGFGGDVLVVVKVNPRDVVAVPTDYNQQKMRTCAYTVEEVYASETEMKDQLVKAKISNPPLCTLDKVKKAVAKAVTRKATKQSTSGGQQVNVANKKAKTTSPVGYVNLSGLTAKEIIGNVVHSLADHSLDSMSLKNKQSILKKATKLFTDKGWKVM